MISNKSGVPPPAAKVLVEFTFHPHLAGREALADWLHVRVVRDSHPLPNRPAWSRQSSKKSRIPSTVPTMALTPVSELSAPARSGCHSTLVGKIRWLCYLPLDSTQTRHPPAEKHHPFPILRLVVFKSQEWTLGARAMAQQKGVCLACD